MRELETFRDMLLAKRRELVGDMYSMEREALQRSGENLSNLPLHMADMGTDNYEQEFTLGLMEKDRQLLREKLEVQRKQLPESYPPEVSDEIDRAIDTSELTRVRWGVFVVSMKDSDPAKVIEANTRFAQARPDVPIHLGVTEAGLPFAS